MLPPDIPEGAPPGPAAKATPVDLIQQQYRNIGETLMICEAGSLQAGIPWLPPTSQRRSLGRRYDPPLRDFIRYSLVGVSTKNLESYCDDLENSVLPEEREDCAELALETPGTCERYASCVLLAAAVFAVSCLSTICLGLPLSAAAGMALVTGLIGGASAAITCQESQRRTSFYRVLYRELLRRRGMDDPNGSRIRLMSVEPN
jgi:hypothetical protein